MVEHRLSAFKEAVRRPRMAWGNAHPRTNWLLVAGLAVLGVLLSLVQLDTHWLVQALAAAGHAGRNVLGAAWLLVLLVAAALALRLTHILSSRRVRRALAGMSVIALLALVVVVVPPRFTAHRQFDNAADELKAQNDVRTSLLQTLGGLLLATGVYLTWRQLQETREGRVTDRYTRAIEQLGRTDGLAVRLGGLYALERIAKESPADQGSICAVLCAYVRTPPISQPELGAGSKQAEGDRRARLSSQTPDVRAAMSILGRWQPTMGSTRHFIDLHGADLRRGDFPYFQLHGADLHGAQLFNADLRVATLTFANLRGAMLQHAALQGADLEHADLRGAHLQHARLQGAQLQHAKLQGAQLQGVEADDMTEWPEGWNPDS